MRQWNEPARCANTPPALTTNQHYLEGANAIMAVSKRTRYEVLKRDNFTCRYCRSAENPITVDHVIPTALGGTDNPDNLVAACRDCNYGKASSNPDDSLVADLREDDLKWAKALARVCQARSRMHKKRNAYVAAFDGCWSTWTYGYESRKIPRAANWVGSISRFYELGVPIEELRYLVGVACGNDRIAPEATWRYFCGCVWRVVNEMHDSTREALSNGA